MSKELFKSRLVLVIFNVTLVLVCIASIAAEFLLHGEHKVHFEVEKWQGLYALVGFLSFILIVFVSKYVLRPLVMRPLEDSIEEGSDD